MRRDYGEGKMPREDPAAPKDPRPEFAEENLADAILVVAAWLIVKPIAALRYCLRGGLRRVFADEFRQRFPERTIVEIRVRRTGNRRIRKAEILDSQGDRHRLAFNRADEVLSWESPFGTGP